MEALLEGKRRLEAAGVDVLGPKDHRFCQAIYFFDPNGIRLEMTLRTEAPSELHRMESGQAPSSRRGTHASSAKSRNSPICWWPGPIGFDTTAHLFVTTAALFALSAATAAPAELRIGTAIEPSSMDPHYYNS
jgi:hypothetical protein